MGRIREAGFEIRDTITWLYGSGFPKSHNIGNGWGTALKPACEFIVMARKPFKGTVANNVLKYGTGAINIDECRVDPIGYTKGGQNKSIAFGNNMDKQPRCDGSQGRWPANLILDEEAGKLLDKQVKGVILKAGNVNKSNIGKGKLFGGIGDNGPRNPNLYKDFNGGASRFFYCAKASKAERYKDNNHPTVKPIKLMKYLCTLVTPKQGTILDPFMGSGSTGIAAKELGFSFIGIELNKEYYEIAKSRINAVL
jgi:site-specific DNA-methyltransferase (adenine-specific)